MPILPPLHSDAWLRVFLAVAECGSLTGASGATGLSQPTVSQQVRLLEDWLGVTLFVRHGRGVRLTEAGVQLRTRLGPALDAVDAAVLGSSEKGAAYRGSVRMASVHTVNAYLLPQVVAEFSRRRPNATLRILCRGSAEVVELVERGQADIGLVYDSMVASGSVDIRPVLQERMALYCPRGTSLRINDDSLLMGGTLRLISFPRGFALRHLLESHYGSTLKIVTEVETLDTMLRLVHAGAGVAILPDFLPPDAVGPPNVERVALPEPAPTRRVVAITRRDLAHSELLVLIRDILQEQAARLIHHALN